MTITEDPATTEDATTESVPDAQADVPAAGDVPTTTEPAADVRYCQLVDCNGTIPPDAHPRRIYCDDHDGRTPERRKLRRQWQREHGVKPTTDEPPRVAFDMGPAGKPPKGPGAATAQELAAVEQRARQICQVVAALVMLGGQNDARRMADAQDIAANTAQLAGAVRDLAQYEPWLRKLGAGGEVSDRAQAWFALAMTAGIMVTPILVRHDVIKGGMAELAGTILANGQSLDAAATE